MTKMVRASQFSSGSLRTEISSAGKTSLIYIAGQGLSQLVGFFMVPVYTRFISTTNYGAMELIDIVLSAIGILLSMGAADSMSRFYYAEETQRRRNQIVSTMIIGFSAIGFPIILALMFFSAAFSHIVIPEPQYQDCFRIGIAASWFGIINQICLSYLRMLYMAKVFVLMTTLQLIIALSLNIWFVVFIKLDILGVFLSTLLSQGATCILMVAFILRIVGFGFSFRILYNAIIFGLPLVPAQIGLTLSFASNRFFLRWMGSHDPAVAMAQVGLYSLGNKFSTVINRFVTVPFNAFWAPRRMELLLGQGPQARETIARMCTYSTLCTLYFALLLCSGIESLVIIMASNTYREAHTVVPYIALSYVILSFETHITTGIIIKKKTTYMTYIGVLGIMMVLLWNYLFVPKWGIVGAATSNLAGFSVRILLTYFVSQKLYRIPFEISRILKMFLIAVFFYAASQTINISSPLLNFAGRVAFVSTFPLGLHLCQFYYSEEIEYLRHFFKNRIKALGIFCANT